MVWMRAAGLPNFRKLFARVDSVIEPGVYTVSVSNGFMNSEGQYLNAFMGNTPQSTAARRRTAHQRAHTRLAANRAQRCRLARAPM